MSTTTATRRSQGGYVDRPSSSSLADVVEMILDKGLVIDAYVRVSLVGIEILTVDLRVVIASVDTYLRFAEATNRLDLTQQGGRDLPEMMEGMTESGAKGKVGGALQGVKNAFGKDDGDQKDQQQSTEQNEGQREQSADQKS
ncbi:gas vesicle protein GvpJ [Citricoccus sp. GCM10030269]|uniref:gas vesicle protein GvpJ n=1 Tax=Citricoccus sp. GCM10030269 TaxID=3273388 RepID=UPI003615AB06